MNKAKTILKAIRAKAELKRTYYVIMDRWSGNIPSIAGWEQREAYACGCENDAEWAQVVRLERRYRRYRLHLEELKPQWREVDRVYWADNSIDSIQEDKDGNRRRIRKAAPSGDACY